MVLQKMVSVVDAIANTAKHGGLERMRYVERVVIVIKNASGCSCNSVQHNVLYSVQHNALYSIRYSVVYTRECAHDVFWYLHLM